MSKYLIISIAVLVSVFGLSLVFSEDIDPQSRKIEITNEKIFQINLQDLAKELNLSQEQRIQIKNIIEAARVKIKDIRAQARQDLKTLLNEEQKTKFEEYLNRQGFNFKFKK